MQTVRRDVFGLMPEKRGMAVNERDALGRDPLTDAAVGFQDRVGDRSVLRPVGPGGVSVLVKMYFTPTGDSLMRRMQSRTPTATKSIASPQAMVPELPGSARRWSDCCSR